MAHAKGPIRRIIGNAPAGNDGKFLSPQTTYGKKLAGNRAVNGLNFLSAKYPPDIAKASSPDAARAPVVFQENSVALILVNMASLSVH